METERCSYTRLFRKMHAKSGSATLATRLFGGMGETTGAAGGRHGSQDAALAKTGTPRSTHKQSGSVTQQSGGEHSVPVNDRCMSGSVRTGQSLLRLASEKRARRVRFYRNGDRFFKGMVYAVSTERFRTFESLLSSLTASAVCDSKVMPNGVRHIFSADGTRRVGSLSELQEGESYVCASTEVFRSLDYCKNEDPAWKRNLFPFHTPNQVHKSQSHDTAEHLEGRTSHTTHNTDDHSAANIERPSSCGIGASNSEQQNARPALSGRSPRQPKEADMTPEERREYEEYQRSFVVPSLITVIRSGKRPRKAVRLLLNKKTAMSFEQVMADVTDAIKPDSGGVKKLFMLSGRRVTCLADFFQGESVFLACDHKKAEPSEFHLDENEIRQVNACRPHTRKVRERITLRKSPSTSNSKHSDTSSARSDRTATSRSNNKAPHSEISSRSQATDDSSSKPPVPLAVSNKYQVGSVIGTGNFAVVMECKDRRTKRKYALKIINKDQCKGKEKMIDNEVRILRCVKHPNIVRLVEDYMSQHHIFYVMELVKGGDLFDAIANTTNKYTEQDAGGMLYNLASALEYLHSLHIVHRDVKPENILIRQHVDGTKSLKLGDFGLATEVTSPQYIVCGTPTYVAPEVIAETGYGLKIDVWSAGVIAYILLCGFPPFSSPTENQDELFDMIMKGHFEYPSPYWDEVSLSAKDVITGMLDIHPERRLTATQVLEHRWVASDTQYENDLKRSVSIGLGTCFRRGPKSPKKHASLKVLTTTALDKSSRFFQGRGQPSDKQRGNNVD